MSKGLFWFACLAGLGAVGWVAQGFADGEDRLALSVTLLIGLVFLIGCLELWQFRRATRSLTLALNGLSETPTDLPGWLAPVHIALQNTVKLRIEGERVALPGPMLTPYLVGLLVMLGLLGTFVGMVVTLQGAVQALQGTTELQAIRQGLAAPIKGLGLAFGTSVAGVAASAMLGLASTLSRRERQLASQRLDAGCATVLKPYSLGYQREGAYRALQSQAELLPAMVSSLQVVADRMLTTGAQLDQSLQTEQQRFQQNLEQRFGELSERLAASLQAALSDAGRVAAEVVQPVVADSLATLQQQAERTQHQWQQAMSEQWEAQQQRWQALGENVSERWAAGLATQAEREEARLASWQAGWDALQTRLDSTWQNVREQSAKDQSRWITQMESAHQRAVGDVASLTGQWTTDMAGLVERVEALMAERQQADVSWRSVLQAQTQQLTEQLGEQLQSLRDDEAQRARQTVERLEKLTTAVSDHLQTLGNSLAAPLAEVADTALAAPRAAGELMARLQQQEAEWQTRDEQWLTERQTLLARLDHVLTSLGDATQAQQTALDALVHSTTHTLTEVGDQFTQSVQSETAKVSELTAELGTSLTEVAGFGSAFEVGVQTFSDANQTLLETLQRLTQALQESTIRSDEQMAYYVAQAREVIDLSLMSQKAVLNELREWSSPDAPRVGEVEA